MQDTKERLLKVRKLGKYISESRDNLREMRFDCFFCFEILVVKLLPYKGVWCLCRSELWFWLGCSI